MWMRVFYRRARMQISEWVRDPSEPISRGKNAVLQSLST
jgi:hypothetical protein